MLGAGRPLNAFLLQIRMADPFHGERELLLQVAEAEAGVETAFGLEVGLFDPVVDVGVVDYY